MVFGIACRLLLNSVVVAAFMIGFCGFVICGFGVLGLWFIGVWWLFWFPPKGGYLLCCLRRALGVVVVVCVWVGLAVLIWLGFRFGWCSLVQFGLGWFDCGA